MSRKQEKNVINNNSHHLSLPEQEKNTLYKLRVSMKKRLSPQHSVDTPSPQGSSELNDMLQRLVEIDTESRELLIRVFSMLEKDEKLENYIKTRIEDPKVSRMWELVEQVLSCQDNVNDYDYDYDYNNSVVNKGIKERDENENENEEELKLGKFKIRNLNNSVGGGSSGSIGGVVINEKGAK